MHLPSDNKLVTTPLLRYDKNIHFIRKDASYFLI